MLLCCLAIRLVRRDTLLEQNIGFDTLPANSIESAMIQTQNSPQASALVQLVTCIPSVVVFHCKRQDEIIWFHIDVINNSMGCVQGGPCFVV